MNGDVSYDRKTSSPDENQGKGKNKTDFIGDVFLGVPLAMHTCCVRKSPPLCKHQSSLHSPLRAGGTLRCVVRC